MSNSDNGTRRAGGYSRPPRSGQFQPGQSGNKKGRPPNRHRKPPHDDLLTQEVKIHDEAGERWVPLYEALQHKFFTLAMKGNNAATKAVEDLRELRENQKAEDSVTKRKMIIHFVAPGNVEMALEPLGLGRINDKFRKSTARTVLEPWVVEAALAHFGDRELTPEEQKVVLQATRTPKKVNWPDWWSEFPE